MRVLRFLPEVEDDAFAGYAWYEEKEQGLGPGEDGIYIHIGGKTGTPVPDPGTLGLLFGGLVGGLAGQRIRRRNSPQEEETIWVDCLGKGIIVCS